MKSRKTYLDVLKIVAIFLVMFNHTGSKGFYLFAERRFSPYYPVYLFTTIFVNIAVPIFYMSSGAVLLHKEESYKILIKKRFIRYFVCLIVFSGVVFLFRYLRGEIPEFTLKSFLERLYQGKVSVHFWYLYSYLAYVLALPFLRKLTRVMESKDYKWMIVLFFIMKSIPIIQFFLLNDLTIESSFKLFTVSDIFFYPLLGFYLDSILKNKNLQFIIEGIILACSTLIICCLIKHFECLLTGEWSEGSGRGLASCYIFVPAALVFYLSKLFLEIKPFQKGLNDSITSLGGLVFGVYLLEYVYRKMTEPVYYLCLQYCGSFLSCVIWIFAACIFGGLVTYVLKHFPVIKELL